MSAPKTIKQQIKEALLNEIKVFPSWEGRGLDNKEEEFKLHRDLGEEYVYPFPIVFKTIILEKRDANGGTEERMYQKAYEQLMNIDRSLDGEVGKINDYMTARGRNSFTFIPKSLFKRVASEFMKKNPGMCVIDVPDLWFP